MNPTAAPLYRIVNWNEYFENNRSRKIDKMSWVPVPNKHDGEGYLTIMGQTNGIIIYGCWHLILQIASKCEPRGTLVKSDGNPHTATSIALKSGWRHPSDFQVALDFCSSLEVGWIEVVTSKTSHERHLGDVEVRRREGMEGKGMEGKGTGDDAPLPIPDNPENTTVGKTLAEISNLPPSPTPPASRPQDLWRIPVQEYRSFAGFCEPKDKNPVSWDCKELQDWATKMKYTFEKALSVFQNTVKKNQYQGAAIKIKEVIRDMTPEPKKKVQVQSREDFKKERGTL
jgi:hypothetical protein